MSCATFFSFTYDLYVHLKLWIELASTPSSSSLLCNRLNTKSTVNKVKTGLSIMKALFSSTGILCMLNTIVCPVCGPPSQVER